MPAINSKLVVWDNSFGLPDFSGFSNSDFEAAFAAVMPRHLAEIEEIANNPDEPTFDNTVVAMELAGRDFDRVASIFWNLTGSHTDEILQELERKLAPLMSRHFSQISMNEKLFARINTLYEKRGEPGLDTEALRVLELSWKNFIRAGAMLEGETRKRFAKINERLASLGTQFAQNILADEAEYALVVDSDGGLDGLPGFVVSAMASAAEEKGHPGKHVVTLSRSIIEPFLTFSKRRDLRETAFKAWVSRGEMNPDRDNRPVVAEIVKLRAEKAKLLGYDTFADFKLDNTMAKTPQNVTRLLNDVWERARAKAGREEAELQQLAASQGNNNAIAPWDWRFYSEQLRKEKFALDEAELKPYFQLDNMIEAAFKTAERLFGLTFREHRETRAYHPDVRVFEVLGSDGNRKAIFLGDYFARSSKRSGAWMSALQSQHRLDGGQMPIIMNNMNFAKPAKGEPVLVSLDDARTLFHEFGHALHGMLSDVTYPSVAGTSVARDFVELPSQLYEHWLTVPETLSRYAVHYKTGEPLPQEMLERIRKSRTFNTGFERVEFTASALVDMAFHALDENMAAKVEPMAFQAAQLEELAMPNAIVMRHSTPHFAHVFSGDGYSAGYYSYMWSGVLDADAFKAFEETGDVFDPETARKLYKNIYSSGGSMDPEDAYKAFRGRLPTPEAMLELEGLV